MTSSQAIFAICIAGSVSAIAYTVAKTVFKPREDKLRSRLKDAGTRGSEVQTGSSPLKPKQTVTNLVQKLGAAAAEPFMPKTREKQSGLRKQLAMAGIYNPGAIRIMTGFKVIMLVAGLLIGYILGLMLDSLLLGLSLGGLIGYLAPTMWLKSQIKKNQKSINHGLPDGLDLMVVCVEAGMTLDSAMQRVGEEMVLAHPALSREFGIAHMETRVGLSKQEALKNLGVRTGNAALQAMAAMLIQADRFGTSIANALRIQSESLRDARQVAAEEMGAKASVKMSFPLVLFIFPATFIVLAGPTVIGLMSSDFMK